jgi:Secretion system C-terminal sorting domain
MKKVLSIIAGLLITAASFAQPYFQATIVKDPANATNNRIIFRMNPTATITTAIGYIEIAFRYATATTPPFVPAGIIPNTTTFPGLNIQRLPDFVSGGFTYVKFVHNTATIASNTYVPNVNGFDLFSIAIQGTPAVISQIELASDALGTGDYVFGVADGGGNFLDPGAGPQLYGPGYTVAGNIHLVPLTNVPVPVKFNGFTATKRDNTALLNWSVENEGPVTSHYEIERSTNGVSFGKIARVEAKNNGATSNAYSLTDLNLTSVRTEGVIYYRIKQYDKDGQFVYSDIKSVRLDGRGFAISVFPNPVKDVATLTIDLVQDGDIIINITDAAGKQVKQLQVQGFKGLNTKKVDMLSMASGTYLLKVTTGTEVKTLSIVKGQ